MANHKTADRLKERPEAPLYRVFVNNGNDGAEDIESFDSLADIARHHLVKSQEGAVTLRVLALSIGGRRLDGVTGGAACC